MGNINQVFKQFYQNYNRDEIQRAYGKCSQQMYISELCKIIPFSVEIRMKQDVLAMQLQAESIVSMELLTVIGFFFDHYSEAKNCVWTNQSKLIAKFFKTGISQFIRFGGSININMPTDAVHWIVNLLQKQNTSKEMHQKLVENFHQLEQKNWLTYEKQMEISIKEEEQKKHIAQVTAMDVPLDWSNLFANDTRATDVVADNPADGLLLSLNNLGRVDIEYIAQITGKSCKEVILALRGSIYQNPDTWNECFYQGWETADEYLSGRVAEKWHKARKANQHYQGYFTENVSALEKILPKGIGADDIYVTLGSPWIPPDIIDDFIVELFGEYGATNKVSYRTQYDESTGIWKIPEKSRYLGRLASDGVYGTKRINALHIIEKTLNMKTVVITDEVKSNTNKSGKRRQMNQTETLLAQEKQKQLIAMFQKWIWEDSTRKERLVEIYEKRYCSSVIRHYDGSFLQFPNMNPDITLYPHQKNAVARMIFSPNTLLAHDVGAGKTYAMIAAGMEMRRIGISGKNLYVVPNNLLGQWERMFLNLYPSANVLCVKPAGFTPDKRQKVLQTLRDDDYDGIIMAHSSFELIPLSPSYSYEQIQEKIKAITDRAAATGRMTDTQNKKCEEFKRLLEELEQAIEAASDTVFFEELGINTLFVDEAHHFKNVPVATKITGVLGVSSAGSAKCQDMMHKVRIVQKANQGRGIVFATGTPVSNSLTDIYVFQKYLQSGELELLGLSEFDNWVGMFAERKTELEIDVDTSNFKLNTRFTKFHNMPELSALLASVCDFYQVDDTEGLPQKNGYGDIIIPKTAEFSHFLKEISQRADDVRERSVSPKNDNMLKITMDGRKAALDMRLIDGSIPPSCQCKAVYCAETVADIYFKTERKQLTQLIFCDTSTPKVSFNLYDELRRLLVGMGIPAQQIAYVHDATTEKQRDELFLKVRTGDVRILIGSTFKLGLGVNVQDRLFALHHLDVPWRPSDMIQREGRMLRSGNQNETVEIYRYVTEGSFDAYSWQILEAKQRMISAILAGCVTRRMCEEINDAVLNYAEVKAISVGNPLLKRRVELTNELERNRTLSRREQEARVELIGELSQIPNRLQYQKHLIEQCMDDIDFSSKHSFSYNKSERQKLRKKIQAALVGYELSREEVKVCFYRGFEVVIPVNMTAKKPFVYLKRTGKYRVEMGQSEQGILTRLDHFLDHFDEHRKLLEQRLENFTLREQEIHAELEKKNDYTDLISELMAEIKKIDKKLGVKEA